MRFVSHNASNIVYSSFNIFTIFIAPSASVFAAQYCAKPTMPENNSVTMSYLFRPHFMVTINSDANKREKRGKQRKWRKTIVTKMWKQGKRKTNRIYTVIYENVSTNHIDNLNSFQPRHFCYRIKPLSKNTGKNTVKKTKKKKWYLTYAMTASLSNWNEGYHRFFSFYVKSTLKLVFRLFTAK